MVKSIEDGFKDIFLAGVGALALTGEKTKEVLDTLIEKGSITVEQGKDINQELQHKAHETVSKIREETIAGALKTMSAEEREEFAAMVNRLVEQSKAEGSDEDDKAQTKEESRVSEAEEKSQE